MGSAASTVQSTKKKPRKKRVEFTEGMNAANANAQPQGDRGPGEPPSPQSPPNSQDTSSSGDTKSSNDTQSALAAVINNQVIPTDYSDGVTFTLVEEIPADLNLSSHRPSAVGPVRESEYRFHVPRDGAGQPTQTNFIQAMDRAAIANWIDRTNSFQVTTFVHGMHVGVGGSGAATCVAVKDGKAPVPPGKGSGRILSPPTVANQPPPAATTNLY